MTYLNSPSEYLSFSRNLPRGGLDWVLGKISLLKEQSGIGTGYPGQWWCPHPWKCLKDV